MQKKRCFNESHCASKHGAARDSYQLISGAMSKAVILRFKKNESSF